MSEICPCGSAKQFLDCCQPLLDGGLASGPEALMRSRFTAFAQKNMDYIRVTTDPQTVLSFDMDGTRAWAESAEFFKLEVLRAAEQGNKGLVEFKAHFRAGDAAPEVHHEISKFRKQAGRWYFREGKVLTPS